MNPRHLDLLRELARPALRDGGRGGDPSDAVGRVAAAPHSAARARRIPLAEPHGRGVRLTEAGRLLADGGRDLARTIAQVQARWDAYLGSASGTVRLAALPSAAAVLLPEVLRRLADTAVSLECTDIDIAETEYPGMVADHDVVDRPQLHRAACLPERNTWSPRRCSANRSTSPCRRPSARREGGGAAPRTWSTAS